jgi:hypothetical protein
MDKSGSYGIIKGGYHKSIFALRENLPKLRLLGNGVPEG